MVSENPSVRMENDIVLFRTVVAVAGGEDLKG